MFLNKNKELKLSGSTKKDLANIPAKEPLKADVIWRSIYEYDGPFYIGVYLTERFLDTHALNKVYADLSTVINPKSGTASTTDFDTTWEKVDAMSRYMFDYDHLAKMFVCYRTAPPPAPGTKGTNESIPKLGVYVHEAPSAKASTETTTGTNQMAANTDGWVDNLQLPAITFKRGTWYRMQAALDGSNLKVSFWEIGTDQAAQQAKTTDTPPKTAVTKTIAIDQAEIPKDVAGLLNSKQFAGSMGVITSGASVEYIVLEPSKVSIIEMHGNTPTFSSISKPQSTDYRTTSNQKLQQVPHMKETEAERETSWAKGIQAQISPQFADLKLTALSQQALCNHSLYIKQKIPSHQLLMIMLSLLNQLIM